MLGQVLFFILGAALACLVLVPAARSYKRQVKELKAQASQSATGVTAFRDRTTNIAAALRESAAAISLSNRDDWNSEADGSDSIGGNIGQIENTINENTRVATEIFEKTSSVAVIASKMEDDVQRGFMVLEKNVKKMQDIKEKNSGTINGIISLSNKVNKIRDIVRVISTITDQTKVIAFNAALEAASAGETGKRFAVVAGEVNRLADDIADLTRQIREQVEEIQSSSSSLIVYSEEGSDRIAEGYKLIKDLEDLFKEIRSSAEISSSQMQTISISTQRQLKSSEQTYDVINEVSRRMKHFSAALKATALSAGTLTKYTYELERVLAAEDVIEQGKHGD